MSGMPPGAAERGVAIFRGIILVNYLPQSEFMAAEFDSGRFNVHHHLTTQDGPPLTLVVLVHGLGGGGYGSWGQLPERLFGGADGPALDVGVYDYRSFHRGIFRRTGKVEFWLNQLASHLREVEAKYSNIVLVGHSLGGVLLEAVAKNYLEARALEGEEGQGSLIALIVVAAPRAGSGWADIPLIEHILPEFEVLRRLGSRSAQVDAFFTDNVERLNVATASPRRVVLPVYAALGGGDKFVSQFSAAFGVPTRQRLYLDAGHLSIKTPAERDAALTGWLHRIIAERLEVREQATRVRRHADNHLPMTVVDPRPVVVTRFLSDFSGLRWEEFYNEVCRDATTTTVRVRDVREVPGDDIHLLIAVHDAALVVAANSVVRETVLQVRAERDQHLSMSVGICPVGEAFKEAEATVRQWLADFPPVESFYVNGAADTADLRRVLARLLQLVIGRKGLDEPNDLYTDPKGGGF
jgi:pimeloyl-ACP methyl ester carboxylesterase